MWRLAAEAVGQLAQCDAQLEDPVDGAFVFGADRREHAVGADQRVDRQQAEVGRRVDDDFVVFGDDRLAHVVQEPFASELADEAHLGAGAAGHHVYKLTPSERASSQNCC